MKTLTLFFSLFIPLSICNASINEDISYSRNKYLISYDALNDKIGVCIAEIHSRPFITSDDLIGFDKRTVEIGIVYLGMNELDRCTANEHHQFMIRAFDYYDSLTKVSVYSQETKTLQDDLFLLLGSSKMMFEREYESMPLETRVRLEERLQNKNLRSYPTFESSPQYGFDDEDVE